jgi:hippurate hydrolase
MQGTLRTYDEDTCDLIHKRIREISEGTAKAMGCTVEVDLNKMYPAIINHKKEADHIERLAKKWFGPEHFSQLDLPLSASEDFSYFIEEKPGAFFALGTLKPGNEPRTLHSSNYDFNDDILATGGYFWVRLAEDRLNVKMI